MEEGEGRTGVCVCGGGGEGLVLVWVYIVMQNSIIFRISQSLRGITVCACWPAILKLCTYVFLFSTGNAFQIFRPVDLYSLQTSVPSLEHV